MSSDESDTEEETAEEEEEEICDSLSEDCISEESESNGYESAIGGGSYGIIEEYGYSECGYYSVYTDKNNVLVYFNLYFNFLY